MTALAHAATGDEAIRDKLVLLFVAAALSVAVLHRSWPASRLWLPAAMAGIAVAIWHGAYDTVLARSLWQPRYAEKLLLLFLSTYVALAALVVLTWFAFPVAALAAFLLYSGVHFGMETEHDRGSLQMTSAIAFGCLPIVAACHWQAGTVLPIFATMLRGKSDAAGKIVALAGGLLVPCILLAVLLPWRHSGIAVRRAALTLTQLLLFRVCPPVLAFAVFFCMLHTPEHLIETSRNAAQSFSVACMWRNLRAGLIPWLISLVAVAVAGWMGRRSIHGYIALLFIALSALTVPHMALAMLATAEVRHKETFPFRSAQRAAHL